MLSYQTGMMAAAAGTAVSLITISANQVDIDLFVYASAHGYTGGDCTITNNAVLSASSTARAAVLPGNFPAGVIVRLINNGQIDGRGGDGGQGAPNYGYPASTGGTGGPALDARAATTFTFEVDNQGSINAGGGGGGGAGGASYNSGDGGFGGGGGGDNGGV